MPTALVVPGGDFENGADAFVRVAGFTGSGGHWIGGGGHPSGSNAMNHSNTTLVPYETEQPQFVDLTGVPAGSVINMRIGLTTLARAGKYAGVKIAFYDSNDVLIKVSPGMKRRVGDTNNNWNGGERYINEFAIMPSNAAKCKARLYWDGNGSPDAATGNPYLLFDQLSAFWDPPVATLIGGDGEDLTFMSFETISDNSPDKKVTNWHYNTNVYQGTQAWIFQSDEITGGDFEHQCQSFIIPLTAEAPESVINASMFVGASVSNRWYRIGLAFYDSNDVSLQESFSQWEEVPDTNFGTWYERTHAASAPVGAEYCRVKISYRTPGTGANTSYSAWDNVVVTSLGPAEPPTDALASSVKLQTAFGANPDGLVTTSNLEVLHNYDFIEGRLTGIYLQVLRSASGAVIPVTMLIPVGWDPAVEDGDTILNNPN